jgi:hypothetical protein
MEKEAEVFGPRTISGFLSQVGAEESYVVLIKLFGLNKEDYTYLTHVQLATGGVAIGTTLLNTYHY